MAEEQAPQPGSEERAPVPAEPVEAIVPEYAPAREPKRRTGLVTIATYPQAWEAHLAAGKLEAEGIPCVLGDENMSAAYGTIGTGFIGGIKLQVGVGDVERARALLPKTRGQRFVRCPKCDSIETREVPLPAGVRVLFLLMLGLPYLFFNPRWVCMGCGHVWARSALAEEELVDGAEEEGDEEDEEEADDGEPEDEAEEPRGSSEAGDGDEARDEHERR